LKICLVNSPNTFELIGNDPVIIKDQQGIYPPLGIMFIASYLLKNSSHEIHIIDAQADNLTHIELAERVCELKPDIVGLTVMTFTLIDTRMVIDEIKKRCNAKIVVGGPHTAIYPNESITGLMADYVIVGEGEKTFLQLANDIELGIASKKIYQQEKFIENLDELPFPARELTNINKYYSILAEESPTTTALSSRGCPYQCTYCDRPALGKNFRSQSALRVVDEMEWCEKHGIKEIFFYDDTFTIKKERVFEICREYKKRQLHIKWDIRARVNTVNYDMLKELKECNLTRIHFGVESAVPRILKELNKGITTDQVYKAFDSCKKLGIKTLAYFMMGTPTETLEDIKENLRMVKRINADYMQMTILSLFPATKIYETAQKEGVVKGDPWLDYVINPVSSFRPPVLDTIYSYEEHEKHLRWFYKKFYLRPKFIMEKIAEIRSGEQFMRYLRGGISLVKMSLIKESKRKDATDTIHRISEKVTNISV